MGKKCVLKFKKMGMLLLFAGVLLLLVAPCHAHRVNVFAWVEGDTVHTESSFPGGRQVKEGKIAVYDDQTGQKLLDGQTDEAGKFSFKVPRQSPLRIELTAGMGHKNEWIVRAEEIAAGGGGMAQPPETGRASGPAVPKTGDALAVPASTAAVDAMQLEKTVERVLDRKLTPLMKMMAESRRHRTTFQDVIGGIGYIIGLAGLGAYIHYRRKIRELSRS
jgi:nickel transport protein